ncbi:MAG: hypothetical protein KJP23_19760 [Deltaproteobacteria bacterium]|nr:hypothetical protein [Deltaproteobacteria bacterium]
MNVDGLVETVLGVNCIDYLLGCAGSEQNADRISGNRMAQNERDQTDPD